MSSPVESAIRLPVRIGLCAAAASALVLAASAAAAAQSPVGTWYTQDRSAKVRIPPCDRGQLSACRSSATSPRRVRESGAEARSTTPILVAPTPRR